MCDDDVAALVVDNGQFSKGLLNKKLKNYGEANINCDKVIIVQTNKIKLNGEN